jgi:hypothetical protein
VKISEVKKVWKLLLKEQHEGVPFGQQQPLQHPTSANSDLLEKLKAQHQPPQICTVSDTRYKYSIYRSARTKSSGSNSGGCRRIHSSRNGSEGRHGTFSISSDCVEGQDCVEFGRVVGSRTFPLETVDRWNR